MIYYTALMHSNNNAVLGAYTVASDTFTYLTFPSLANFDELVYLGGVDFIGVSKYMPAQNLEIFKFDYSTRTLAWKKYIG